MLQKHFQIMWELYLTRIQKKVTTSGIIKCNSVLANDTQSVLRPTCDKNNFVLL